MDNFEKRLKQDAELINPEVSSDLRSRIDASLRSVEPLRPVENTSGSANRLWWLSSLTGLATAVAVIVLLNLNQNETESVPTQKLLADHPTVPDTPKDSLLIAPMLDIQTADFANPLEEELEKLQSDLEKVRNSVKEDVDFTF